MCINTYVQGCAYTLMDMYTVCACLWRPEANVSTSSLLFWQYRGLSLRPQACNAPTGAVERAPWCHFHVACDGILLVPYTLVTPVPNLRPLCRGLFTQEPQSLAVVNSLILQISAWDDPLWTTFPRALAPELGRSFQLFSSVPSQCALTQCALTQSSTWFLSDLPVCSWSHQLPSCATQHLCLPGQM